MSGSGKIGMVEDLKVELEPKARKFLNQLKESDISKTAILCGYFDPDGGASGWAFQKVIEKLGGTAKIFYKGTFTRPQNKIFKSLLGINVYPEDELNAEKFTTIAAIDCPLALCEDIKPDFLIDHHTIEDQTVAKAVDTRIVGACSTLLLEYCRELDINFKDEDGQKLSTALLIGCITDCKNGMADSCTNADYEAMAFLHQHKDNSLYKDIINYPKPPYYNDLFCQAWENKTVENTILVSGVGVISESRIGILSDLAEKFIETEGVNTAVIFGIVDNKIDISIRTNSKLDVDEFVKNAFGGGGGRIGAARAVIEMPVLFQNVPPELNEELYQTCFKIVRHKALQIAGDKK